MSEWLQRSPNFLGNLNIVLDTIEEVENLIDNTNIEIERDQNIQEN